MSAAATRTAPPPRPVNGDPDADRAEPVGPAAAAQPAPTPYKGTFEMSRQDAKRLRLVALEHDTSVTRLVQAAAVAALDDPEILDRVLRVHARLHLERT